MPRNVVKLLGVSGLLFAGYARVVGHLLLHRRVEVRGKTIDEQRLKVEFVIHSIKSE